jgi:hypothetical protein
MKKKLPVKFDERHEQAYQIYLDMGPTRTFKKVAAKMGVSAATIANWSLAYGWTDRLHQDIEGKNETGLLSYFTRIAAVRNNGIEIIDNVMAILKESLDVINKARAEKREIADDENKILANNRSYLNAIGWKVNTGKDLRDLVNALGEIIAFQPGGAVGGGKKLTGAQAPISVSGGSVLILQGLKPGEAKEILKEGGLNAESSGTKAEERSILEISGQ